jgi:hypothetical protein
VRPLPIGQHPGSTAGVMRSPAMRVPHDGCGLGNSGHGEHGAAHEPGVREDLVRGSIQLPDRSDAVIPEDDNTSAARAAQAIGPTWTRPTVVRGVRGRPTCGPPAMPDAALPTRGDIAQDPAEGERARSEGTEPDLDLRAVRCLIVLSEERHYAHAAERLHLSQPGLSRVISGLEQRLRMRLVQHGYRPVTLTAAGEVLVAHGRALLDRQRVALTELRRAGQWPR